MDRLRHEHELFRHKVRRSTTSTQATNPDDAIKKAIGIGTTKILTR